MKTKESSKIPLKSCIVAFDEMQFDSSEVQVVVLDSQYFHMV
jgi:hypothetical protein